jgi:hypothetical protein
MCKARKLERGPREEDNEALRKQAVSQEHVIQKGKGKSGQKGKIGTGAGDGEEKTGVGINQG